MNSQDPNASSSQDVEGQHDAQQQIQQGSQQPSQQQGQPVGQPSAQQQGQQAQQQQGQQVQATPVQNSQGQAPQTGVSYQSAQAVPATSGLAVAGLVLGVVAVLGSFLPIINNVAFFIGIIGLVLAIVGLKQTKSGAKKGSGMAVAGIVCCIASIVITLMVQAACSAALDSVTSNSSGKVAGSPSASSAKADTSNMGVGQTVELDNGLSITVNSVETGLQKYDGSEVMGVTVTYVNNGKENASFNMFDWKAEDANGAQRSETFYGESTNELSSGTLSPGGTVTGSVYFDAPVKKVYYYSNLLSSTSDIAWVVG